MSEVRSHGNASTELKMVKCFRKLKIKGWRRNQKLPGQPDFVFRHKRIAVFVDGCFWHGCPICYVKPKSNIEYWQNKIDRNIERDVDVDKLLDCKGWTLLRFWEHELDSCDTIRYRLEMYL